MANDVLITPASKKIEFFGTSALDATVETDVSGNLVLTSENGVVQIGDAATDVYIGNGINNVDIIFEADGEIRGTTGVNLTLGQADSFVKMGTTLNLNSNNITNGGTITATTFSGALSGNASTASKWATARSVTFATGDVTGSFSIDGSANVGNVALTVADNSHNHTSLTGVTSISFAAEASDTASISTTVSSSNTYFDFNLSDDPTQADTWRWRFTPSGGTVFDAMTLDCSAQNIANLTVPGTITATTFSGALSGNATSATNADTVDSLHAASFLRSDANDSASGIISITNTTASTSSNTGALTVAGGVGISGALNVGGTITATTFNGTATQVSNTLNRGSYLTGSNYNGSAATTWAVDATSANTASKVVARDASGNFSAGTITASLSGNATSATNADTVDSLHAASFLRSDANDSASGIISITNTTASTSTTTGALTVAGGVGISENLNVGGTVTLSSAGPAQLVINADTDNVNENDNASILLKQDGGAVTTYIGFDLGLNNTIISNNQNARIDLETQSVPRLQVGNTNVNITPTTISSDSATGALTVAGGVGIAGALNVGGSITGGSIIKSGATSNDVLLGDGTTTSLSGIGGGSGYWTQVDSDIYYNTGNVGIGTSNPTALLTLSKEATGSSDFNGIVQYCYGDAARFQLYRANGTAASPTVTLNGDNLSQYSARGHTGSAFTTGVANINMVAEDDFSTSTKAGIQFRTHDGTSLAERMRITSSGNVGIGQTSPDSDANYDTLHIGDSVGKSSSRIIFGSAEQKFGIFNFGGSVGAGKLGIYDYTANAERLSIDANGNVTINGALTTAGSLGNYAQVGHIGAIAVSNDIDGTTTTPTRGDYGHHIYQCRNGTFAFTLTDSSWTKGDLITFCVAADATLSVTATVIRVNSLEPSTSDGTVTYNGSGGARNITLLKHNTTTGAWQCLV
jgi:hypothetical protein